MSTMEGGRRRVRMLWWTLLAAFLLLIVDYIAYPIFARIDVPVVNTGCNGLWIRYSWYFGERSDADLGRLIGRLRDGRIHYAYFHVRYVKADGHLRFHYPKCARHLTSELHRECPDAKAIGWIYAGGVKGLPPVDLSDRSVRRNMVTEAAWLVKECGFDGVQWDYEICPSNDRGLIALLQETRAALPKGALLSVCTPMWYPFGLSRSYGWEERFFWQVAAECDQLAVMGYDSAVYLPRAYVWLMREQAARVTRAAAEGNPRCRVIIGVPTYEAGGLSHHARAENLRMALKGVREGLADPRAVRASFDGVALFADYTTSSSEWHDFRRDWLGISQDR